MKAYIEQGATDMVDFIHRIKTERRFKKLEIILGETNIFMASFAIRRIGFGLKRDCYGERSADEVLAEAKQAELRLQELRKQLRALGKDQENAFLEEHRQEIIDADKIANVKVQIEITKDALLTKEDYITSLRDRLRGSRAKHTP